jgi:hypothetical protein
MMKVNKYDYIKNVANSLQKSAKKRDRINERIHEGNLSFNQTQKIHAELAWVCMEISKDEERLCFALGQKKLSELRDEYSPSGWHTYKGLKGELENLKFE